MQEYDRTTKWLIQHHGDAILRLAGVGDIVSWRPLQAVRPFAVRPSRSRAWATSFRGDPCRPNSSSLASSPTAWSEARLAHQAEPGHFVLEIATYPDERLLEQVLRDMRLVYLDRRALPEVLVLVLRPKGNLKAEAAHQWRSPLGWTRWQANWRVVELWTVPAADLLAAGEVGVIPWVPLARIDGPPAPVIQQCRERIDRDAPASERENLLAVTQVLTRLRYNDPNLLIILGGEHAMIESPLLQEYLAKRSHKHIAKVLQARFGPVPLDVTAALQAITAEGRLDDLDDLALRCPDLDAFRAGLLA